jgi:hypothetical protein
MAPTYPRTVRGLLTALTALDPADTEAAAAALVDIADRVAPRRPLFAAGATKAQKAAVLHGEPYRPPGYRRPSPQAATTARIARHLAYVLRQLPRLIVALQSLTAETAEPVSTAPLAIPDPVADVAAADELRDAGTGQALSLGDQPAGVFWWPALPPAALQIGYTQLPDVPTDDLVVHFQYPGALTGAGNLSGQQQPSLTLDIVHHAETMSLLRGRGTGWHEYARGMRGGGHHAAPRNQARSTARSYRDWVTLLAPIGDRLAADWAAALEITWTALEALTEAQGETMPTLTQSAVITSLATRIRDQITAGHGGRLVVSDSEVAFAWAPGPSTTLLNYLATHTVDGRHTTVVRVSDSATKAGPVAEGAAKPAGVVTFTSDDVDLQKFAGIAEMPIESAQFVSNIEPALSAVMVGQIVRAIEADAIAAITADAGVVITAAADITAGVLAAIAGIRGNGGTPTVVGLNSDDWIALMTETGTGGGYVNFSNPEAGPAGTWLGLAPVLVPGLTAGSAIVADGSAVSVLEPAGGPLAVVDIYTGLANNLVRVVIEEWATSQVTSPGGVATVGVTTTP